MALYQGEEMIDVATPDGRTLTLPRSLVPSSMMPQPQQIIAPPVGFTDEAPGVMTSGPESVTGGQIPSMGIEVPNRGMPAQPDYKAGVADNTDAAITKSNKPIEARQQQVAAYQASPRGRYEAAQGAQRTADVNVQRATEDAGILEAATQTTLGEAREEHDKAIDAAIAKKASDANQALMAEDAKRAELETVRKKIAGTKIDRSADHPIIAALSVALANIGAKMNGDNSAPGMKYLYDAIDRKVAGQMADLEQMGKVYGMQKDELATLKEKGKSKLELNSIMVAAETDKAQRHLEQIAASTSAPKTLANTRILSAQLAQHSMDKQAESVQHALDFDQKEKAEANQQSRFYSGLRQDDKHFNATLDFNRQKEVLDYEKALAAERAKGGAAAEKAYQEQKKENEQRGIRNVITKEALLTPKGRQMKEQAAKYEADANEIEQNKGPMGVLTDGATTRMNMLRDKAAQLRDNAETNEIVRHRDPLQAGKLADNYSAVQNMTTTVDEVKELYDREGRKFIYTKPGQAALQSKMVEVLMGLKTAWGLGVLSQQDINKVTEGMGETEPIDGWTPGYLASLVGAKIGRDPEAFKTSLDSLLEGAQNKVYLDMNGTNYGGTKDELFYRRRPHESTPEGKAISSIAQSKTPLEREKSAANVSGARKAIDTAVAYASGVGGGITEPQYKTNIKRAQESGTAKYPGFARESERDLDTLFKSYESGNRGTGELLVAQAVNNAESRPDLALSTMHVLRDRAPALYSKAREGITGPLADQLATEEKNIAGAQDTATPILVQQLFASGDDETKKELARRASAGDKEAQKATRDFIMNKNIILPQQGPR